MQASLHAQKSVSPAAQAGGVTEPCALRVFVVSDVRLYCEGLSQALALRPNVRVLGALEPGHDALARMADSAPDVVLIDSPTVRRTDIVRRITAAAPACVVVAFGVSDEPAEVLECAQAGASGYVPRSASVDDLLQTAAKVVRGELPCPPTISAMMFRYVAAVAADLDAARMTPLTIREREIAMLIDRGLSNKEIAGALSIGEATVKSHVHHILDKLGVQRRGAVMRRLTTEGRAVATLTEVRRPR